jgi:hypothetical protein
MELSENPSFPLLYYKGAKCNIVRGVYELPFVPTLRQMLYTTNRVSFFCLFEVLTSVLITGL